MKTPHTLTVVRTHLAFVTDARTRGDEHGHLDWTPEVSHPLSDGEKIITDALMHYTLIGEEQRTKLRAFVEVDRTTMSSERLASKLIEYARLWSYEPQPVGRSRARQSIVPGAVWLRWYPVFPGFCSCSPEPPGTSWATGSATCRPWSRSTRSWPHWPGRCRWARRSWTTSNCTGLRAMCGLRWAAASHAHGPHCDSARPARPDAAPQRAFQNPLQFAHANHYFTAAQASVGLKHTCMHRT